MKIIGKILMLLATFIIVVHTIVPHQHKAKLEVIIHECFFSDSEEETSIDLFGKLGDVIKHVNLGEKHLENFRVSTYEYEFSPVVVFNVSEILSLSNFHLKDLEKPTQSFFYISHYISAGSKLSCGLRAPPFI